MAKIRPKYQTLNLKAKFFLDLDLKGAIWQPWC